MSNCDECGAEMNQEISTTANPFDLVQWSKEKKSLLLAGIRVYKCPNCENVEFEIPRLNSLNRAVEENPQCDLFIYGWHPAKEK